MLNDSSLPFAQEDDGFEAINFVEPEPGAFDQSPTASGCRIGGFSWGNWKWDLMGFNGIYDAIPSGNLLQVAIENGPVEIVDLPS